MRTAHIMAILGLAAAGLALTVLFCLACPAARAESWDPSTITVDVDDYYLETGNYVNITVSGENDTTPANNIENFDMRMSTYSGTVTYATWESVPIDDPSEKVVSYKIPGSIPSGTYYLRVFEPGKNVSLDYVSLHITKMPMVSISIMDSYVYIGDVATINLVVRDQYVTQVNLLLNDSVGGLTRVVSGLAVFAGSNYFNWTVPPTVKPGYYDMEVWLTGGDSPEDTDSMMIQKHYVYITASVNPGKYGYGYYVPGETITVRVRGGALANYTVNITNSKAVAASWPRVQMDSSGSKNLTATLRSDLPDGEYNLTVVEEDGTEHLCDIISVQMYMIDIYPEREAFLKGETFTAYYAVRSVKDGSLARPASGTWILLSYVGKELSRDTFTQPSGSFQVQLPSSSTYSSFSLEVWFNDTSSGRTSYESIDIETGDMSFSLYVDSWDHHPGGIVVVSFTTEIDAGYYYGSPLPGVTISNIKVSTRKTGDWTVDPSYNLAGMRTDAQGKASLVLMIGTSVEDQTEFKIEAQATKAGASENASDSFTVRKAAGISAAVRTDRLCYGSGQMMHISVATYAPTVTGAMTYLYMIVPDSYDSTQAYLVQASASPTLDWTIPSDVQGTIKVTVSISSTDGASGIGSVSVPVYYGLLTINPDPPTYRPNSTVKVHYSYSSEGLDNPDLFYRVTDNDDNLLSEGKLPAGKTGTYNFRVPAAASETYYIMIYAIQDGRMAAYDSVMLEREPYYSLSVTLDKDVASPGETIKISYKLVRHSGAPAAGEPGSIEVGTLWAMKSYSISKPEGTIDYKLPAETTEGPVTIYVSWDGIDGSSAATSATVTATKAPAGIVMSRSDILLLLIAVVSLIAAIAGILRIRSLSRRLKRMEQPGPPQPAFPAPQYQAAPPAGYSQPPQPPSQAYAPPPQPQQPVQQQYQAQPGYQQPQGGYQAPPGAQADQYGAQPFQYVQQAPSPQQPPQQPPYGRPPDMAP